MKRQMFWCLGSCAALVLAGAMNADAGNVDFPRFPSVSPDGKEVVFSWRGDLWKGPATGGAAMRLTSHAANELRSAWSPDGRTIAFDSDRSGFMNLHVMNADGTNVRQVTSFDRPCVLAGFAVSESGAAGLAFTAAMEGDIYRSARPYFVSLDGGEPVRLHDAFGTEPAVSADGKRMLFTRGGSAWSRRGYRGPDARDTWLFDRGAKSFTRITDWAGNDGMARWRNDAEIVFASDRELGCVNLYRLSLANPQQVTRLTSFDQGDINDFEISRDGSTVVFLSWDALYRLDLNAAGAQPVKLAFMATEDEGDNYQLKPVGREVSDAALSPDGKVMAVVAYGEVYVRNVEDKSPTRRVTFTHARERGVAWSPDGLKLYFSSDEDGSESIYAATVSLSRREVREQIEEPVKKDEEPADEPAAPAEPAAEPAKEPEPAAEPAPEGAATSNGDQQEPAEPKADEPAKSEEKPKAEEKKEEPLPKELDPERWHDALLFTIQPVVKSAEQNRDPSPSPDGKWLAFRRGNGNLMLLDLTKPDAEPSVLVAGWDGGINWRWSPDSKQIAYAQNDLNFNSDIFIMPIDGSAKPVNITRHPDNDSSPRWSADGRILTFVSQRVNDESDVWMVYLDRALEALTPAELEAYYKEAAENGGKRKPLAVKRPEKPKDKEAEAKADEKAEGEKAAEKPADAKPDAKEKPAAGAAAKKKTAAPKPDISLDDAYMRLRRVTRLPGNEGNVEITAGGDRYIYSGDPESPGLYSVKHDGTDRKRLTGAARVMHMSLTGDLVVMVSGGSAAHVKASGGEVKTIDVADTMRIDLQAQSSQKFLEAARVVGESFYHPTMKDLDWAALTAKYHELAKKTRTASEFNEVGARFLGELNGSHLGISASSPPSPLRQPMGRLGTRHKRVGDGFEVVEILPRSPASRGLFALRVGDVITSVEGRGFEPGDTLEGRLQGRVNVETLLGLKRKNEAGEVRDLQVLITPISGGEEQGLRYDHWRNRNAALVSEWSDGKLGYIHIESMGQPSLDLFERDLYAAMDGRKGLIIDVRNNGGGWTADRLLSSIMVQEHAYTIPRGADVSVRGNYPQDRLFIQRCTLPINMLCNEKSFSNAEIISHAFKTLKRGTLVGQQTYGGVISTGGTALIDGTFVRIPFRGWYLPDGTDMENNGAMPDILVPQTPEDEAAETDRQLRTAVEDLLKRVE